MIYDSQHHIGHIGLAMLGKGEHAFIGFHAKLCPGKFIVLLCGGSIEADGNCIKNPAEGRGNLVAIFQLAESIGIQPGSMLRIIFLHKMKKLHQSIQTKGGLTKTAEDNFSNLVPGQGFQFRLDFIS